VRRIWCGLPISKFIKVNEQIKHCQHFQISGFFSVVASKNWRLNVMVQIQWRSDWSVNNFDAMKIQLCSSMKFDGAGV